MKQEPSPETLAAQAMGDVDATSGALTPAIHPSTTYERSPDGTYRSGLVYTRADNPTYDHAERLLGTLEGGAAGMLFASGSAAATAVFQSLLPGDHVLVSRVLYWGVRKWLAEFGIAWGLDVEFIDTTDLGGADRHPPGPHPARVGRDPGQPDVGHHRPRRRRGDRPRGRRAHGCRRHRRDPRAHTTHRIRGRPRRALGDQVPERPRRRSGRGGRQRASRPVLRADPVVAAQRRLRARSVRGVAAPAGHADLVRTGAPLVRECLRPRPSLSWPPGADRRSLSGAAVASRP